MLKCNHIKRETTNTRMILEEIMKNIWKKLLAVGLAAAIVACVFAGCAQKNKNTGDNSAKSEGDTFTVGFDAEFPPYGYQDEKTGEYVGFDLDLAREVCKRNGWTFVAQPIDWDSKDGELNSGNIDCIWNGFTKAPNLLDKYTWSESYVNNSIMIATLADSDIKSVDDLKGKVIASQSGSSAETAVKEDTELMSNVKNYVSIGNYQDAYMQLKAGAFDALFVDIGVAKTQDAKNPGTFKILDDPYTAEEYAIGFKLGSEALKDQVQTTLKEMVKDGTFAKIAEQYELSESVCLEAE